MNDKQMNWNAIGALAGVLSAALAGLAFFEPTETRHNYSGAASEKDSDSVSNYHDVPRSSAEKLPEKSDSSLTAKSNTAASLDEKLTLATKISSTRLKDDALRDIVGEALENNDDEMAFKAAEKMWSSITSSAAYGKIADSCLSREVVACAIRAARLISSTTQRDAAWIQIAQYCHMSGQRECMTSAVSEIYSTTLRDAALQQFLK